MNAFFKLQYLHDAKFAKMKTCGSSCQLQRKALIYHIETKPNPQLCYISLRSALEINTIITNSIYIFGQLNKSKTTLFKVGALQFQQQKNQQTSTTFQILA